MTGHKNIFIYFTIVIFSTLMLTVLTKDVGSRTLSSLPQPIPSVTPDIPPFKNYKGVEIGMKTEVVRQKLGDPKESTDTDDSFKVTDHELAQVYYDADHKVTAITITYDKNLENAPTPKAVFGEDGEVKPDGGIFKMMRFPEAGFFISYTKTGGDDPIIMIAIQKI